MEQIKLINGPLGTPGHYASTDPRVSELMKTRLKKSDDFI
jgi:hypothetical protein